MKLIECVDAYMAVETLMRKEMDFRSAYALAGLSRELRDDAMFYSARETEIMKRYAKKDEKGRPVFTSPGTFAFAEGADPGEYERERRELGSMEVSTKIKPVKIKSPERITPEAVAALTGLVIFEEGAG